MGFNQAVSGLNAAASNLDVIGNNIANSQTVGFKSGSVTFADMFAGSKVGLGVKVASVQQDFTDGITTTTNRGLDVAISGNGFSVCRMLTAAFTTRVTANSLRIRTTS